jgi:hypothetical protein
MKRILHPFDVPDTPPSELGGAALRIMLPLLAACFVVWLEPMLGRLAHERPGIVPVTLLSLVVGVLHPVSRRWLVSTLCFGVALLAVRDVLRALQLPAALPIGLQEPVFVKLYALGWAVLAALAGAAAVAEAVQPGAVWGRRCYFLAVAVYFTGHGTLGFLKEPTWRPAVMFVIGMMGLVGARMADRMVEPGPGEEPLEDDLKAIEDRSTERSALLTRREWVEKS